MEKFDKNDTEKTYRAYLEFQQERVARPIRCLEYDMSNKSEVANIVFFSDVHYGDKYCEIQKFRRHVEAVSKMDNAVVILNGDLVNNATIDAPPSVYDDILRPDKTIIDMAEMLRPIKDKIAVICSGNHELWTEKKVGIDPTLVLAQTLGLSNLYASDMWLCNVKLKKGKCPKDTFVVMGRHGSGGGKAAGAAINKVDAMADAFYGADMYAVGHLHKPGMSIRDIETVSTINGKVITTQKQIMEVSCSSYQGYNRFAAKHAMKPSSTDNRIYQVWNGDNPDYKDVLYKDDIRKPKYKAFCNTLELTPVQTKVEESTTYTEEEVKRMVERAKQDTKEECFNAIGTTLNNIKTSADTERDLGK